MAPFFSQMASILKKFALVDFSTPFPPHFTPTKRRDEAKFLKPQYIGVKNLLFKTFCS